MKAVAVEAIDPELPVAGPVAPSAEAEVHMGLDLLRDPRRIEGIGAFWRRDLHAGSLP